MHRFKSMWLQAGAFLEHVPLQIHKESRVWRLWLVWGSFLYKAFEKAENDLRQLTSSLNDYVNSKEAMKALGKAQYNAWKKTQKAFLDGF